MCSMFVCFDCMSDPFVIFAINNYFKIVNHMLRGDINVCGHQT